MDNSPVIIRSMVFVSAHDKDRIMATADMGPDAICMDMEDLTPLVNKEDARRLFPEVAAELKARGIIAMARVNALDDGMAEADLEAIVGPDLHCVHLPKVESAEVVAEYDKLIDRVEKDKGISNGYTLTRPIIETAKGVKFAYEIASASPRTTYMGGVSGGWWGDLASSLGYLDTADGAGSRFTREKVLIDVRAAGVPFPIGGGSLGSSDVNDIRAFFNECKVMGYTGAHCKGSEPIVQTANEVFVPDKAQLDEWLAMLPGLEQAERDGLTSTWVEGRHLDLVCLPRVRSQVALATRVGMI
jgi:citrate lyase subunit beta/citryl-CoA lyase